MSAISIGSDTALRASTGAQVKGPSGQSPQAPESSAPSAFAKWIPGEALTFYAAILGLGAAQPVLGPEASPQQRLEQIDASAPGWFLAALAIAVVLVVLGAVAGKRESDARCPGVRWRHGAAWSRRRS